MMSRRNLLIALCTLLVGVAILGAWYTITLQKLVNEGVSISNQKCTVLASLKKQNDLFKESIQVLTTPDSKDEYLRMLDEYFKTSEQNVSEQEQWLSMQNEFMERWDYKLLMPPSFQELGKLDYDYWKTDTRAQQALIETYKVSQLNKNLANELGQKSLQLNKERDFIQKKIDLAWNKHGGKPEWRLLFIKIPQSKC